ncbi:MAG: MBL fold metallo-hydrolase [Parcubacteria group bacterium CG10_big_fil_rev_8_21_14_0_10_36_14]|nr:MAG: MBL fold metallo-hydrolase [Parcubacteria group bacterium CG10_big_fil_rev_8_21_14_0_10_36_14]
MKNKEKIFIICCTLLFISDFSVEDIFIRQKSRAVFCDVGQGDGIFINLKDGVQILVDGGPDNKFVGCVGNNLPYFDHRIEYMIISHPDKDHFVGAVEILRRYDVGKVFISGDSSDISEYQEFLRLAKNKLEVATKDSDINFENGKIDFMHLGGYKDSNDSSLIFKLIYNGKSILFTGDAPVKIEDDLINSNADLKADILKVGHHGSKNSTSEEFLRAISPFLAIISVGENNYGHPSYRVIKNLENADIKYKRTDEEGDIAIQLPIINDK